jgi:hypothetical protein
MVVSTLIPQAVDKTLNVVEFYYPEDIANFEREFIEAEQASHGGGGAKHAAGTGGMPAAFF